MAYQCAVAVWNYGDSNNGFRCFPPSVSSFLENCHVNNPGNDEFIDLSSLSLRGCFVNLKRMLLVKDSGNFYFFQLIFIS